MYKKLIVCIVLIVTGTSLSAGGLLDAMPRTMVAQNFTLPQASGEKLSLNELQGKFVLVNFWTTKCTICRAELTILQDLRNQLEDDDILEIVAIHAGPDLQGVNELLEINTVNYPIVMDMDLQLGHWGIPSLPTSYLITPDGNFAYRAVGSRLWNSPPMVEFLREIFADYEKTKVLNE